MKTYPIYLENRLHAFEITSTWFRFGPLLKILKAVPGTTEVRRQFVNHNRVAFCYQDVPMVIYEPWGASDRYWIGCEEPENSTALDLAPLKQAFDDYHGHTIFNPKS